MMNKNLVGPVHTAAAPPPFGNASSTRKRYFDAHHHHSPALQDLSNARKRQKAGFTVDDTKQQHSNHHNHYSQLQDTASSSEVAMPGAMDTEMPDAADAHPSQQMLLHRQQQEMQARPDHEPVIMLDITETPDPEIEDYLFDFYYRKKVYEQNATSLVVNNQQ